MVGLSTYPAYLSVDRQWISPATLAEEDAVDGRSVSVIWGAEPDGGTRKPGVEHHVQKEIRATICPWPYSNLAKAYRPGLMGRPCPNPEHSRHCDSRKPTVSLGVQPGV